MRAAPWLLLPMLIIGWDHVTPQTHWSACGEATEVSDLPLVEMPPSHRGAMLAVFVSGDGGWRAIDRLVADGLHDRGAGVLPFMINRLPQKWRDRISPVALISLEPTIDFQVTPFDLLRTRPTPAEIPVREEVEWLRAKLVLCFCGVNERHSLCRSLSVPLVTPIAQPGSHHHAGNYDQLARTIWLWSRHPSPSAELRMTVSTGCQAAAFSRVGTPWPTSGLRGCRHSTAGAARLLQRSGGGILARRSS